MTQLIAYLHFDGTCKEAMEFYKGIFDGELEMNTVGESKMPIDTKKMPGATPEKIMHARLKTSGFEVMASDMMDPSTFTKGDTVSLCVVCESVDQLKEYFSKISVGGDIFMQPKEEFFGWFASVTDKFGIDWMFQYGEGEKA